MVIEAALQRELEDLGPVASESTLAASALALARRLDKDGTADTAVPALARELREALDRLRAAAAEEPTDRMTVFERRRSVAS